jgi:hypothetical protein
MTVRIAVANRPASVRTERTLRLRSIEVKRMVK